MHPIAAIAIVSLVSFVMSAPPASAQTGRRVQTLDRIAAVVNNEVITRQELTARVGMARRQLQQQNVPLPPMEALEKQLLDRLINERAQLNFAKETGLRVTDAEVDRAVTRIAQDNQLSLQTLRETLEKDGVPFIKFREDIRNEIILSRLREREVESKIVVTDAEIDNFINTQKNQDVKDEEYNLSHILIVVPENASPEQIQQRRARAEQAIAQLKEGTDFRQVAATFSEAPDALQGGVMGWRQGERLPTLFHDALKNMKNGEITTILRSANGFHILRVNERRGSQAPVMVTQTKARHILIKMNELVSESEAQSRLRNLKERLENKSDFAELARVHSEDTSASRGGDLGWISPGDTVPEFERAMDALKPGEISNPVQSPFGWHLIQVLERRNEDMSKERTRLMARQALRARKVDEAYQEWVRQLRDRAYVENRLEER